MLCHKTALVPNHRPTVPKRFGIGGSRGDKRFDGDYRIFLEPFEIESVPIIGDFARGLVEASPNTVARQVFNDFVTALLGLGFNQEPNVGNKHPALYPKNGLV